MAYQVPTIEPDTLTAGDLWTWTRSLADYPPADGWVLSYSVVSNGNTTQTLTATTSGTSFLVSVAASTTASTSPGLWFWQARVTKGSESYTVGTGRFTVLPNFATSTADPRSLIKRTLDAIEANLAGSAVQNEMTMTVDGVALSYRSFDELLRLKSRFTVLYQAEIAAERGARGLGNRSTIHTRFRSPT